MKKSTNFFLVVLMIMLISGASFLGTNVYYLLTINLIAFVIFNLRKCKFDTFFLYLIGYWSLITLISSIKYNGQLSLNGYLGSLFYLFFPYFTIKALGSKFWPTFEKIIYRMTLITFPIFLLSTIFPDFFASLHAKFIFLTNEVFFDVKNEQKNYWYSFFFTYSGRNDFRNSGFMWEPGGFAMILIATIFINWSRKGIKLDRHELIYFTGIITTLSTAGFIALLFCATIHIFQNRNMVLKISLALCTLLFIYYIMDQPFMQEKILQFIEDSNNLKGSVSVLDEEKIEVNRLLSLIINIQQGLINPIGYGATTISNNELYSEYATVNGLGDIIVKWGWLGIIAFLISLYKMIRGGSSNHFNVIHGIVAMIPLLVVFFSNPIVLNPILWLLIFTPYLKELRMEISLQPVKIHV